MTRDELIAAVSGSDIGEVAKRKVLAILEAGESLPPEFFFAQANQGLPLTRKLKVVKGLRLPGGGVYVLGDVVQVRLTEAVDLLNAHADCFAEVS